MLRELISQQCDVLIANPMIASSPPLTRGLDTNKKNEIRSAQSRDISSLNLGVSIEVKRTVWAQKLTACGQKWHSSPAVNSSSGGFPNRLLPSLIFWGLWAQELTVCGQKWPCSAAVNSTSGGFPNRPLGNFCFYWAVGASNHPVGSSCHSSGQFCSTNS
jgi:hypothetical protein